MKTPPLTQSQQIAIAIIPKFTSLLSIVGSLILIIHIMRNVQRKVYHRLILGMSFVDVISSFKSFLSTWPVPRGSPGVAFASGTTQTCTAAGFFGHGSSLASPLYNGSLALFYLLTIRYGWKTPGRFKQLEPWMHGMPLMLGWGTAIAGLPLKLYNSIGWTCWIAPSPLGCKQTYEFGYTTCERGDNAYIYRWAFFHGELWLTYLFITWAMVMIYLVVLQTEKRQRRYSFHSEESKEERRKRNEKSRKVAFQGFLYVGACYLTWIFPTITWLTQLIQGKTYTAILFLQAIFVPLQGLFNMLIYLRPRYQHYREKYPDVSTWMVIRKVFAKDGYEQQFDRGSTESYSQTTKTKSSFHSRFGNSTSTPKDVKGEGGDGHSDESGTTMENGKDEIFLESGDPISDTIESSNYCCSNSSEVEGPT